MKSKTIFILGDVHLPWCDWAALEEIAKETNSAKKRGDEVVVVQIGDLFDQRAWSRFPKEGHAENAQLEWDQAEAAADRLNELFPDMKIIFGNHDERIAKKATEGLIPRQLMRSLNEYFSYDGWEWHTSDHPLEIDGIAFIHGDTFPIPRPIAAPLRLGQSVVYGHTHQGALAYVTTHKRRMFALNVGWLGDEKCAAFQYARGSPHRCFKGYGVIIDGVPHLIPIGEK